MLGAKQHPRRNASYPLLVPADPAARLRLSSITPKEPYILGGLDQMTHRGPFQPLTFCGISYITYKHLLYHQRSQENCLLVLPKNKTTIQAFATDPPQIAFPHLSTLISKQDD